jgi:hypothetical protein
MTRKQKLIGIAVIALLIVGGGMGVAVHAARSPMAIARAQLANDLTVAEAREVAQGARRACVDMQEGSFEWRWANVPFASTCEAGPDAS